MTKTFRFIGMVLMAVLVSVSFNACSSDDDDNDSSASESSLLGRWICTSSTFTPDDSGRDSDNCYLREDGHLKYGYGIRIGDGVKLFAGGKCFLLDNGYAVLDNGESVADPTESQWYQCGYDERWMLSGGVLSIIESDDDRFVGTYKVDGNKVTFTYKTQDWNWDSHTMTGEYPKTYVSVLERK